MKPINAYKFIKRNFLNEIEIEKLLLLNYKNGIKIISEYIANLEKENKELTKIYIESETE